MKDEWIKKLHDSMENFEMDAPDGLWESLEHMSAAPADEKPRPVLVTRRLVYGIAASVMAILSLSLYFYLRCQPVSVDTVGYISEKTDIRKTSEPEMTDDKPCPELPIDALRKNIASVTHAAKDLHAKDLPATNAHLAEVSGNGGTAQETTVDNRQQIEPKQSRDVTPDTPHSDDKTVTTVTPHSDDRNRAVTPVYVASVKTETHRFSLGAYTTGGLNSNLSRTSSGDISISSVGPEDTKWNDNPKLGILLYNQGKEITTDIRHRQPIRAGLSVGYRLSQRISLVTGMTYANLTSDIREGSESHYFTGEQVLHYIGIPLSVRCDVIKWKRLNLYASAGVLAEKNISGKVTRDYVLSNRTERYESGSVTDRPLQWSLNLSSGIEFNLTRHLGIFAEPGVSYYIDNGSPVRNIYKERPVNFNLNLGLRFMIDN